MKVRGTGARRASRLLQGGTLDEVAVRIGELRVARGDSLLFTIGLGSCVAVALYDGVTRIGGLAHAMLPHPRNARPNLPAGRFASSAVPELLALMRAEGALPSRIRARIAGGASMFRDLLDSGGLRLGRRNVEAVRAALQAAGIPIDGEDVFGTYGRSLFLRTTDGSLLVTSVDHDDVVL
jgi:chemotaxis protein CheD